MRKHFRFFGLLFATCLLMACNNPDIDDSDLTKAPTTTEKTPTESETLPETETEVLPTYSKDPSGMTLSTRFPAPSGYTRTAEETASLAQFLRDYPLKEDGSPVLLYNGNLKSNQYVHAAVFSLPLEAEKLQQCADSVMRMYAEYFWATGQQDRILFHLTNGFPVDYKTWREGNRIALNGNDTYWVKSAEYDDSYETFVKYMRIIFAYAGTLSMDTEATPISLEEMQAGDVFLKGGSPGHVVMVVDVCENADGKKAFLLAQGYMPAQEFHVINNPAHEDDPWYYEEEMVFPLRTAEYTFSEGSAKRLSY